MEIGEPWGSSDASKSEKRQQAPQFPRVWETYKGLFTTSLFRPELTIIPLLLWKTKRNPILKQDKWNSFSEGPLEISRRLQVFTPGLRCCFRCRHSDYRSSLQSRLLGLGLEDPVSTPSWSNLILVSSFGAPTRRVQFVRQTLLTLLALTQVVGATIHFCDSGKVRIIMKNLSLNLSKALFLARKGRSMAQFMSARFCGNLSKAGR